MGGEIDHSASKLLRKLEAFFDWCNKHMPGKHKELSAFITTLDPASGRLPEELQDSNVQRVKKMSEYFNIISHHGKTADASEFEAAVNEFEHFLLERLRPRTFEDVDDLDALIKKAETND